MWWFHCRLETIFATSPAASNKYYLLMKCSNVTQNNHLGTCINVKPKWLIHMVSLIINYILKIGIISKWLCLALCIFQECQKERHNLLLSLIQYLSPLQCAWSHLWMPPKTWHHNLPWKVLAYLILLFLRIGVIV